jgi:hypothetical protein
MTPYYDPTDPDAKPAKQRGEAEAAYRQRVSDWYARRTSVVTVGKGSLGIPAPSMKYAATGATLGDFQLGPMGALPSPSYSSPRSTDDDVSGDLDPYPIDVPPGESDGAGASFSAEPSPMASTPWGAPLVTPARRFGPSGALAPGLRTPTDPTPEELERARVLAATGYDTAWGTPASPTGLRWSATRYVYEPTLDKAGVPYRFPARDAMYLQPYPDETLGSGLWSRRWVRVSTPLPDPARPYRVLDRSQGPALGGEVGATTDGVTRWENPLAAPFVPTYGPPKRTFKLTDYAWVGRDDLPVGCPYPYPAMPVPQADYASGRWLDADYVPSIPLPPPYDQTPWQCGVPRAPGKPHKGPSHYTGVENFTPPPRATAHPDPSPVDALLADPKPDPAKVQSALEDSVRRANELRRSVDLALRNGNRTRAAVLQGQLDAAESDRRLLAQLKSRLEAEHGKPKVGARPSNGDVGLPPPTGSAAPRSGEGDGGNDPEPQTDDDGVHYATPKAPVPGLDRLYAQPKDLPPPGIPKPNGTMFDREPEKPVKPEPTRPCGRLRAILVIDERPWNMGEFAATDKGREQYADLMNHYRVATASVISAASKVFDVGEVYRTSSYPPENDLGKDARKRNRDKNADATDRARDRLDDELKRGDACFVIIHLGHRSGGHGLGMSFSQSENIGFSTSDLNRLPKGKKLPLVASTACNFYPAGWESYYAEKAIGIGLDSITNFASDGTGSGFELLQKITDAINGFAVVDSATK